MKFALVTALLCAASAALAGPPFQTDDPEPVPYRNYEAYAFGTVDRSAGVSATEGPAFEFNAGAAPNLQLHIVVPIAGVSHGATGIGDIETGIKYRFVSETETRPQIGTFPMFKLPTGNAAKGLGNGHLWMRLPLWLQKSRGPWTTYGGAGYTINHAAGMRDAPFAGWLVQRKLSDRLTLGAATFYAGATSSDSRFTTLLDAGGYATIRGALSLLFMAGRSIAGDSHAVAYLGLYYTWGVSGGHATRGSRLLFAHASEQLASEGNGR